MPDDAADFIDPAEDCPWLSPRKILAGHGYSPLPPAELDDRALAGRLWELLYAAAARRFFFSHSNHLSDRELYSLLWTYWLDKPTPDIPLEAETNTRLILAELGAGDLTSEEIWLRYYADEASLELWRCREPDFVFPPHEDPPHDRDQFLPVPPIPLEAHAGWVPEDDDPQDAEPDPLGLAGVDEEIACASAGSLPEDPQENPSDAALESELRAIEPENWKPPVQSLAEENVPLLPPPEITDEVLTPLLWELLHNLALRGFYLRHTDHLSDRELYAELWHHGLREPAHLPGRNPRAAWFHDFLGSWDEEDTRRWLRYYATDEERAEHARDWPKYTLPPKEKPGCRRDWRLPKGPF